MGVRRMIQECEFKIEKDIPIIKDARKGSKHTNPLYIIAQKMEIGDSIRFPLPEFVHANYNSRDKYSDEEWDDMISKEANYNYWSNAPKSLRRYLLELYGKGSVAERNLRNIPEEKTDESGVRVWRIK